jgi:hypothetical protein
VSKPGQEIKSKEDLDKLPPADKAKIEANITKACSSYETLAKGLPAEKVNANKPQNCP